MEGKEGVGKSQKLGYLIYKQHLITIKNVGKHACVRSEFTRVKNMYG